MANISVIIPVYNAQNTIEKTINSVLKSKEDIELILVIDGLTDNSLNICEEMKKKDNRIKIIIQENKGALCARINGIKSATGKYIMFLDADDEYIDGVFSKMNEIINKYSPDLIKFRYKKENYEQYKYFSENEIFINKKDFSEKVYPMFFGGYQLNAIWNSCVKKSCLDSISAPAQRLRYAEDLMMNLNIFTNINSVVFINDIYYFYNTNSSSITQSRKSSKKWLEILQNAVDVYSSLFLYLNIWNMYTATNVKLVQERLEKEVNIIINILKTMN